MVQLPDSESPLEARLARLEATAVSATQADEVDLAQVFSVIWGGKWLIVIITSAFAVLSVALALWLPNQYKATVILTPASSNGASALSQLASQFGGLASLAGINLGSSSEIDKSTVAIELMKTWGFQEKFIRDNQLEVPVFAATRWDRKTNSLAIDGSLYDVEQGKWVRDFDPDEGETAEPNGWELYEEFSDRISISQDKSSGMVTVSVEHYSPHMAKDWVEKMVAAINLQLRQMDKEEASKNIEYLQQQASETSISDMKTVFYKLIEEQTKNLMLTEVSDEYVFKTVSPAKLPEEESKPKRVLICIGGTLLGMLMALGAVFVRSAMRRKVGVPTAAV